MNSIKLVRNDLDELYRPNYYTDRYLLTDDEYKSVNVHYDDIIDFYRLYGRFLESKLPLRVQAVSERFPSLNIAGNCAPVIF